MCVQYGIFSGNRMVPGCAIAFMFTTDDTDYILKQLMFLLRGIPLPLWHFEPSFLVHLE